MEFPCNEKSKGPRPGRGLEGQGTREWCGGQGKGLKFKTTRGGVWRAIKGDWRVSGGA